MKKIAFWSLTRINNTTCIGVGVRILKMKRKEGRANAEQFNFGNYLDKLIVYS